MHKLKAKKSAACRTPKSNNALGATVGHVIR